MRNRQTDQLSDEVHRRVAIAETALSVRFSDRALLAQALTHPSYANRDADARVYERLEFLGDSVLGLIIAEFIFRQYPDSDEGAMAELRAALVSGRTLAALAERIGLGEAVLMDRGVDSAGGRRLASVLADCFEAVVGAYYLDQGLDAARSLVLGIYEVSLEPDLLLGRVKDYKSELQERVQASGRPTPVYHTIAERGPAHERVFTVEVCVASAVIGQGEGRSKKDAERAAASDALTRLG